MTFRTERITVRLAPRPDGRRWYRFNDLLAEFAAVDYDDDPLTDECTFRLVDSSAADVVVIDVRHDGDPPLSEWTWPRWATVVVVEDEGRVAA